jgi:hypothetical protein
MKGGGGGEGEASPMDINREVRKKRERSVLNPEIFLSGPGSADVIRILPRHFLAIAVVQIIKYKKIF